MSLDALRVEFPRFYELIRDDWVDCKVDPNVHVLEFDIKELLELLRYGF